MCLVQTDEVAFDQIAALPDEALWAYAEVLVVLELTPWHGHPMSAKNPKGAVRTLSFGRGGIATYLILEDQLRVDVLRVIWAG